MTRETKKLLIAWGMLFLLCILSLTVKAQTGNPGLDLTLQRKPQYATVLNGSTQYWSKSSPVSMDLNGGEMITAADDRTFETTAGNWATGGNHSLARSTAQKYTGTASGEITATAAGDSTTNYESLPASAFTAVVSGNKYTLEIFAYGDAAGVTLSIVIGDQKKLAIAVYSAVAGTFTRVVFNFQATANTLSQPIRLYLSGAGNCYIDNVSLTQAYDMLGLFLITVQSTSAKGLFERGAGFGNGLHDVGLYIQSGNPDLEFNDADRRVSVAGAVTISTNVWHVFAFTIDRTGNGVIYFDGVSMATSSILAVGNPGSYNASFGTGDLGKLNGSMGTIQLVRFTSLPSDIATTIAGISKSKPLPQSYTNGAIVFWCDWKNQGYDKSGTGNTLTPTGSPPIQKVRY